MRRWNGAGSCTLRCQNMLQVIASQSCTRESMFEYLVAGQPLVGRLRGDPEAPAQLAAVGPLLLSQADECFSKAHGGFCVPKHGHTLGRSLPKASIMCPHTCHLCVRSVQCHKVKRSFIRYFPPAARTATKAARQPLSDQPA